MIRLFAILLAVSASAFAQSSPKPDLHGVMVFQFGSIDDSGSIAETTTIPWKLGGRYGWRATIFSKSPVVTLKEVLILPTPADWIETQTTEQIDQIIQKQENLRDGRVLSREVKLDVTKPLSYGRNYKIIRNDPEGQHVLRLYINGELAREVKFSIKKPRA